MSQWGKKGSYTHDFMRSQGMNQSGKNMSTGKVTAVRVRLYPF